MTAISSGGLSIAVVGGSVRGTSLVERLLASAPELVGHSALTVHVIDPYPPGSGRVWRAGQRQELIMNTVAGQSTLFTDDSVHSDGPVRPGPNLAQWCRLITADPSSGEDIPADVRAEAADVVPWSNPSRLLYGHYLRWCFDRIVAEAPQNATVVAHRARALDVRENAAGPTLYDVLLDDGTRVDADAVVFALGWLDRDDIALHPRVVPPGNPIDQDLAAIAPDDTIVVRGLGMGFFDTLSQLTEQRGGHYRAAPDGSFTYERGGFEPLLLAGSSRGVPFRAKPDFGAPPFFPEQRILRAALPRLIQRRPVDFGDDILPLIERDAAFDYYRALDTVRPGSVVEGAELLRELSDGDQPVDDLVGRHVPAAADRLLLRDAENPLAHLSPTADAAALDAAITEAVRRDIAEAALGARSPLKLALHSYAAARSAVIPLVEFGGLTPSSYAAYRRFLKVAAAYGSGPPLRRARHLLAAHEAGVVRFVGPGIDVEPRADHVLVRTRFAETFRADWAVEAWLPAPSVERTADPLLNSLLERGLARTWRFSDGSPSDALEVRPADGALIGAQGAASPGLFSVGVPHEDNRVFTIIAPVPGTNSSVLRETDAAARAALLACLRPTDTDPAAEGVARASVDSLHDPSELTTP